MPLSTINMWPPKGAQPILVKVTAEKINKLIEHEEIEVLSGAQ